MLTVLEILQRTSDFLTGKGVENARFNAECLVGHALGLKRMQLYLQFERLLSEPELEKIRPLVRRRASREPLQYILGEVGFGELTLKVDRRALIPRPETEYLIELIESRVQGGTPNAILDLGTGTGAIALALAHQYPAAQVTAVDTSAEALALAAENAEKNQLASRVTFLRSHWFEAIDRAARFDLIVANPPYLSDGEVDEAQPEVRLFEPRSALAAPENGLRDLRLLIESAHPFLAAGGLLALETGIDQHPPLATMAERSGLVHFESVKDLTGRPRYVFARALRTIDAENRKP